MLGEPLAGLERHAVSALLERLAFWIQLVRRRGSSLSPAAEQFVETLLRQWPSYTSIGTSNPTELGS